MNQPLNPWRLSVAPMMDWTDRHCRYFHRLITKHTRLYTEMVTTGALLHGDVPRHLDFNDEEHPVALQLGGSEPADLAHCARLGEQWGYNEINLNCGCPSERVQRGAFGACLMAEPKLVRDCVAAMVDVVSIPVTVKHRIGIDKTENYDFVRDFVGTVAEGGCNVFIVHARNAWLKGLSPKENREIPPLRYDFVYRLKQDFPSANIVLNGGVKNNDDIAAHLQRIDGVMVGREAYQHPWTMASWDALFWRQVTPDMSREQVWERYSVYVGKQRDAVPIRALHEHSLMRHAIGLYNGLPGARRWRQALSNRRSSA